jgi:hypothetical protein
MGKSLFIFVLLCAGFITRAQTEPALKARLDSFMVASQHLNIKTVMHFTYPKLFKIVPQEQMEDIMEKTFNNPQISIQMDSIKTDSIYPVFKILDARYAKIMYSIKMIMAFKNDSKTENEKKNIDESIFKTLQKQYGNNKVTQDSTGAVSIYITAPMVAIKDQYAKKWCFINLKEKDPLMDRLFSKAVLSKLASYK